MTKLFELEKINRRNAAFDLDKCFWLNGQYIAQMSLDRFVELSRPFLEKSGVITRRSPDRPGGLETATPWNEEYLRAVLAIVKEKIKLFKDVQEWTSYFFTEDYEFDPAAIEKSLGKPEALDRLRALRDAFQEVQDWNATSLETSLKQLAQKLGCKTGDLVHPARVAVSGRSVGPSLYHMLEVMGKERVFARFARALEKFNAASTTPSS